MQITQAMKMVSAAKLKKAQTAIISMRPYSENLLSVIEDILKSMPSFSSPLVGEKSNSKRLIISITSNRFTYPVVERISSAFQLFPRQVQVVEVERLAHDFALQ